MTGQWWRVADGTVLISVRLTPRSARTEVVGVVADVLRIRVAAPPVDGAANEALVRFIAKKLGVARSSVTIEGGGTGRSKMLRVTGNGLRRSDLFDG